MTSHPAVDQQQLMTTIQEYEQQLEAVKQALSLISEDDSQKNDLLDLKNKLEEVIRLTKDELMVAEKIQTSAYSNSNNEAPGSSDLDAEFLRFQSELAALEGDGQPNTSESNPRNMPADDVEDEDDEFEEEDEEISRIFSSLPGQKCQAPFQQEWGELSYHNALILSVDIDNEQDTQSIDCVKVRVLFINPTCDQMKPCPYFLENTCKFSDDKCKYSHGYEVSMADIREYVEPDFSTLARDSVCLAKYSDGLWYKAVVEDVLADDNKFSVKFTDYGNTEVVNIEDIYPLDTEGLSDDDSSSSSESEFEFPSSAIDDQASAVLPTVSLSANTEVNALGEWEKHTTGIGSKLMAKMGYVWGQGLGKNGEGRTQPIEAVILPQGKSLDKCMELREKEALRDPFRVKKKQRQVQRKKEAIVTKGYHRQRHTVFDFLNKKIAHPKGKGLRKGFQKPHQKVTQDLKNTSSRGLNIEALQVTEDIRKAEQEISKLKYAAMRNKDRDRVVHAQLLQKITAQQQLLKNLQSRERSIQKEQQMRSVKQKLCVF